MVFNVGYLGKGKYKSKNKGKITKVYYTWHSMIKRCYSENYQRKHITYIGITVCSEWLNFQNFAEWFEENYKEGFSLDKDIICPDCKLYSPETCCFVPREINSVVIKNKSIRGVLLIGVEKSHKKYKACISKNGINVCLGYYDTELEAHLVYKDEKEKYIKELANKWKGLITCEVYNTLLTYTVYIDD